MEKLTAWGRWVKCCLIERGQTQNMLLRQLAENGCDIDARVLSKLLRGVACRKYEPAKIAITMMLSSSDSKGGEHDNAVL